MNKTVNINLSGIIFHIEEDAYNKLHSYLSTIKGYFSESEGRDEIMADIENRIAEMLSEKVSDKKQVVLMVDIDRVIEVMGKPEDFAGEQPQSETKKEQPTYSSSNKRKRVFRDPDNQIVGGVCSGIANYFNIDPLWLRLALAVSFFAFGTGFILYIVLWIVIPEAKTASEKLEMRGEDVNFSNIGKKVEEEMNSFGKKMESWGEEVKHNTHIRKTGGVVHRILDFIASVLGAIFRVFIKFLGVIFIVTALILLVAMVSSCINWHSYWEGKDLMLFACIAIILSIGIPSMMLVYWGFKILLGIKKNNRYLYITAGILWIIGLVMMGLIIMEVYFKVAEQSTSKQPVAIIQPTCDTLFLRLKEIKGWDDSHEYRGKHNRFSLGPNGISIRKKYLFSTNEQDIYFDIPKLDIVREESDSMEIVMYKKARGMNKKEALQFSKNINYDITQKDSLIELMPFFSISKDEKWHFQELRIEVRIPKGKTVYLDENMKHILFDVHNETDTYDADMVDRRWIMGEDKLRCMDCEGLTEKTTRKNKKEKIKIGPNGIDINSGNERIKIDSEGIHIESPDGNVEISKDGVIEKTNPVK